MSTNDCITPATKHITLAEIRAMPVPTGAELVAVVAEINAANARRQAEDARPDFLAGFTQTLESGIALMDANKRIRELERELADARVAPQICDDCGFEIGLHDDGFCPDMR